MAGFVQRIEGTIGYVEYAYAVQNKLSHALMQNQAGKFIAPTVESFSAAAASADWKSAPGYFVVLTDQPGEGTWPIVGASFILIHKSQGDPEIAKAMLEFFSWCYRHGAEIALAKDYVPIPMPVVEIVENTWRQEVRSAGQPAWK